MTSGLDYSSSAKPPVPPQRLSSTCSKAPMPRLNIGNSTVSPHFWGDNDRTTTTKMHPLVVDLELKYGDHFHKVTSFPRPPPFLNIRKVYPSRTVASKIVSSFINVRRKCISEILHLRESHCKNRKFEARIIYKNSNTTDNRIKLNGDATTLTGIIAPLISPKQPLPHPYGRAKKNRAPAPPTFPQTSEV